MEFECSAVLSDMDGVLVGLNRVRQTPLGGCGQCGIASIQIKRSTRVTGCERDHIRTVAPTLMRQPVSPALLGRLRPPDGHGPEWPIPFAMRAGPRHLIDTPPAGRCRPPEVVSPDSHRQRSRGA
jgi:hypothetical protein